MTRRVLATAVLAALAACSRADSALREAPCTSDDECAEGQLCFPEGCGNPGKNIAVEVLVNSRVGHHAQDFLIPDLKSVQNIEVFAPTSVKGELQRLSGPTNASSPSTLLPYSGSVTVRAVGESVLIPGIVRRYETTVPEPERGAYAMSIGVGQYTLIATPAETAIPSVTHEETFLPGESRNVNFVFPSPEATLQLTGRLLKTYAAGPPPVETPITTAVMEIQAIDPATGRSLSQRAPVSSGYLGSKGDFTLAVAPAAASLDTIVLVATPKDGNPRVPSKSFVLQRPFPQPLVLELGDFGEVLTVAGRLKAADGQPIRDATVYVEGKVQGGGIYRSRPVPTEADGSFQLQTLPSARGASFTLTALPPEKTSAGLLQTQVQVNTGVNVPPALLPTELTCPERIAVTGSVARPDGWPAAGVKVLAEPIEAPRGGLLPARPVEAYSDPDGRFSLQLDPAVYRLDFLPGGGLPRRSREIAIAGTPLDLGTFQLSNGRSVTGTVRAASSSISTSTTASPNATLRFFRVSSIEGKRSAILLGEAVTDQRGGYSIVLPTR